MGFDRLNPVSQQAGEVTTPLDILQRYGGGRNLLEVGCGNGTEARRLAMAGYVVRAIDRDSELIEVARETPLPKGIRADFEVLDFLHNRFIDQFDIVYERGVIHNSKSHRERLAFARRIARALVPAGIWVSICGSADDRPVGGQQGGLYLSHLVSAAERYFEVLYVERRPYGTIIPALERADS